MSKKRNRKSNKNMIKFKKDLKEMAEWCESQMKNNGEQYET